MFNELITIFSEYSKTYPVLAGVFSLWLLSTVTYLARNIPLKIFEVIKRQGTTHLTMSSSSSIYHIFLMWCIKKGYTKNMRTSKISNGKWGMSDEAIKSIGYGTHYFLHGFKPIRMELKQVERVAGDMERDEITISTLGRSQKFFDGLFNDISNFKVDEDELNVSMYSGYGWEDIRGQRKRDLNTLYIKDSLKKEILDHINSFIENEDWYLENGLSYQTGILLYGKPGCGKSSLIKALASKYNKELCILKNEHLCDIEKALSVLPKNSILLIEDIDINNITKSRKKENLQESTAETTNIKPKDSKVCLSTILNSLDGIITTHGRIVIATTNFKESLDEALIRDGRFNLKIELGLPDEEIVFKFFNKFYPDYVFPEDFKLKKGISSATIQKLISYNLDQPDIVVEELKG